MGCSYECNAKFTVKLNEQDKNQDEGIHHLVAVLRETCGNGPAETDIDANGSVATISGDDMTVKTLHINDEMTIEVSGFLCCSYSRASDIDSAIQAFGNRVAEPVKIYTVCDGDEDDYWIGNENAVILAAKNEKLNDLVNKINELNSDEVQELRQRLVQLPNWA